MKQPAVKFGGPIFSIKAIFKTIQVSFFRLASCILFVMSFKIKNNDKCSLFLTHVKKAKCKI